VVRRAYPVRTCVGCRGRAPSSELLRVVAVPISNSAVQVSSGFAEGSVSTGEIFEIVPDPSRRMPGRGAHLHFDPACLAQAVRRRAFGRALRVAGIIEMGLVTAYVTDGGAAKSPSGPSKVGRLK
jgi:uncharacterized protein